MPTYAYACTACEHQMEVRQSFSDDALTECPQCSGRLRKRFDNVGVVFKGSGFYRNDSRSTGSGGDAGSGGGSGSSDTGGSGEKGSGAKESDAKGSPAADSSGSKASSGSKDSSGSGSSGSGSSGSGSSGSAGAPAAKPSTTAGPARS